MADVVVGLGTSHSPMLTLEPQDWLTYAEGDKRNPELVAPPDGLVFSYEELVERTDPAVARGITPEKFQAQHNQIQSAINTLKKTLAEVKPDVTVIISDDQDELLFEDLMPAFSVYWGDTFPLVPYPADENSGPVAKALANGWGDIPLDVPVDTDLGRHIIEYMIESDFDMAHSRYIRPQSGGAIARRYPTLNGESTYVRVTEERPFGLPHGWSFIVKRIMNNAPMPIVPIFQNVYPPNQPTPRRSYAFGQALRKAINAWDSDKRVALIASGGLSHFVVDEEIDRMTIKGLKEKDVDLLCNLPRHRLNSASSEIRNWVAAAGALEDKDIDFLEYVPVYRTPAGTGGGWTFARWT